MIVRPLQFNVFLYLLSLKIHRKQYILFSSKTIYFGFEDSVGWSISETPSRSSLATPTSNRVFEKDSRFFRDPSNLGFFDTFSGAPPDLQKARRLATSRPLSMTLFCFIFSLGGLFISEIVRSVPSW